MAPETTGQKPEGLEANLRAYTLYLVGRESYFWMPVFFLYFGAHLPVAKVLLLEAVYYIAVVVLEVPSGWASDRFGRKPTLVLSSLALLVSYLLFFGFTGTWWIWAIAQMLLAAGLALASGTDTSLLYDSLAALGRQEEYGDREASLGRMSAWVMALGAVVGGASSLLDARWAYLASAAFILISLFASLAMREPPRASMARSLREQLGACGRLLAQPVAGWLFAIGGLFVVLSHVPYEFYQPYLQLESSTGGELTPLYSGVHAAAAMFLAGWAAGASMWLVKRMGTLPVLLLGGFLQVIVIGIMGALLHPVVIALLLARGVPSALTRAPLRQALMPRLEESLRATFLSLLSLFGRLLFGGLLILLALVFPDEAAGDTTWSLLSGRLSLAAGIGLVGMFAMSVWGWGVRAGLDRADQIPKAP